MQSVDKLRGVLTYFVKINNNNVLYRFELTLDRYVYVEMKKENKIIFGELNYKLLNVQSSFTCPASENQQFKRRPNAVSTMKPVSHPRPRFQPNNHDHYLISFLRATPGLFHRRSRQHPSQSSAVSFPFVHQCLLIKAPRGLGHHSFHQLYILSHPAALPYLLLVNNRNRLL